MTAPVIGARTPAQLARLDEVSAFAPGHPHDLYTREATLALTRGDLRIETRR